MISMQSFVAICVVLIFQAQLSWVHCFRSADISKSPTGKSDYTALLQAPGRRARRISPSLLANNKNPRSFINESKESIVNVLKKSIYLAGAVAAGFLGDTSLVTKADDLIDLNVALPEITDTCWIDISIDNAATTRRIEIQLFGTVAPITSTNFKLLCLNQNGIGYKGSDIFRVISTFSIQGGNIGAPPDTPLSRLNRFGKAANNDKAFPPENFRILHSFKRGGVISMMKDVTNKGLQDSRFFITLRAAAGWADDKYVAFGLVSKGLDVINEIAQLEVVPPSNHPAVPVKIVDSGCY